MGIERARVVEVHAATSDGGRVGSGYLISDRLVLTCDRVVGGRGAADVRPAETAAWLPASVVWSAPGGAAVLEVDDPSALFLSPRGMRWGAAAGPRPVAVTATGFPPAAGRPSGFRDPVPFVGHLVPSDGPLVPVTTTGNAGPTGDGMSGAALFAGSELVGVLVVDRGPGGAERTQAVPASSLAADVTFVELVGDGRELMVAPVSTPPFAFPILPAG